MCTPLFFLLKNTSQVASLFFTCTVILYQAEWMQQIEATCVILVVCTVNMLCSLTRVDRNLLRALAQTFEWPYLILVFYTFIAFNSLTQQQFDVDGHVRPVQWDSKQIHGFIQALALCSPIAFMLAGLDAVPLYPLPVKCGMLFCGLAILLRVLVLDLINYAHRGSNDTTDVSGAHMMCIGTWVCTTVKAIGNLFAGQVSFFLVRHTCITVMGMRGDRWKQMTILNVPLLLHPHFEREDYREEQEEGGTADEKKADDDKAAPTQEDPVTITPREEEPGKTTIVHPDAMLLRLQLTPSSPMQVPLQYAFPTTPSSSVQNGEKVEDGGVGILLSPPVRRIASSSSRTFSRTTFDRHASIGGLHVSMDGEATPNASRRQSVRIVTVAPSSPLPMLSAARSAAVGGSSRRDTRRLSIIASSRSPLAPTAEGEGRDATPSFIRRSSLIQPLAVSRPSPVSFSFDMQASPVSLAVESSVPISPPCLQLDSPLPLPEPPSQSPPQAGSEPSPSPHLEALAASKHRIDHRDLAQAQSRGRIASEFAFEVGGYTQSLYDHTNTHAGLPWLFPVEFRSINPFRRMRKYVLGQQRVLQTWLLPLFTSNLLVFGALALWSARSPYIAAHPAVIACTTCSFVISVSGIFILGATVSDRFIFRFLVFRFELALTMYQILYVLCTQLLLPTPWYMWLVLWLWYVLIWQERRAYTVDAREVLMMDGAFCVCMCVR
jgi:hypothetical protein